LASKPGVTVSSGLASKPAAMVSSGLASKPVAMFFRWFGLKTSGDGLQFGLKTGGDGFFQFGLEIGGRFLG
jgi:hypothetical protein